MRRLEVEKERTRYGLSRYEWGQSLPFVGVRSDRRLAVRPELQERVRA